MNTDTCFPHAPFQADVFARARAGAEAVSSVCADSAAGKREAAEGFAAPDVRVPRRFASSSPNQNRISRISGVMGQKIVANMLSSLCRRERHDSRGRRMIFGVVRLTVIHAVTGRENRHELRRQALSLIHISEPTRR